MSYRERTGEARWANVDLQEMRIRQGSRAHIPGWRGAWNWCLKHRDYVSADLIFDRNKKSDECEDGDHDDCYFSWCRCEHHSAVQFRIEHKPLRSCADLQSEQEELEMV